MQREHGARKVDAMDLGLFVLSPTAMIALGPESDTCPCLGPARSPRSLLGRGAADSAGFPAVDSPRAVVTHDSCQPTVDNRRHTGNSERRFRNVRAQDDL